MKSFEQFFLEEKLDAEDREKIKEDDWGIIIKDKDGKITEKAYPMPDAQHVISAARMYPFAKRKYDSTVVAELRRKIIAKAKEYNVPDSRIQSVIDDKPGGKSKAVKESVGPEDDDTSGTSEFDEYNVNEPDDCYVESKNESIHMRPATKADLDRMYRWEMESIDKELQKDPKVQKLIREDVEQSIKDTQMIMDGRVTIGMFTACMIDDGEWRYIGEIYLIPSYRGRGIGSGILRKEIEQYPKIRLQVATSNDKAIKLYKSLGFKIVKENKKQKMYLMEYTRDTIQESWNTEESLKLFKKLPKDLQEFLKKGDISDIDEDYGIDGYIVEEFSAPEYLEIAGKSYDLKDDDPMYNAIDFATDGGGNDFVYDPDDGYYYNLDHEDYDIYDHIHGDRLSSTTWSELIDPTRKSNKSSNPNVEITHEFGVMTESHLYWDICHVVLDDEIDTKLCNKITDDYDVARKGTWHDEFFKKVDEFASKYDCSYIKAPVDEFKSFMKRDFRPTMFNWNFNIDGLKTRCMDIIKAFMKVIKELDIDTAHLNPPAYKLHKQIIEKYGTKMFQEGVIQNIKNKTGLFEKDLVYHISPEGHLDGQIFKPRVPDYLDKYDPTKTEFEDVETPRVCFSPSIEGCLNAIIVNIGRWKTAEKLRDWYVYIPEKPLKEYKYRTNKQLIDEKKVYDANITKEIWIEEPVRLKQYGVIRIDSVTDKSRKKAVPTTLGESKKRNVYDFKWHWLVKPKVLKDVPYDYSPLEVCKDMVADLESYKYGIPENGRIVSGSEHDYDTKWKLQSPEEFEKNRGGICYDYVEFEEGYLEAYGIKCKKYFISTDLPGNDTHTFILVDDGHGGYLYPESSFKPMEGVHEAKSIDEILKIVANGFWKINNNKKNRDSFEWHVWEYTGHPKYGSNIEQCMKYYSKGEPKYEGVCKDDDPKPKVTTESTKPEELIQIKGTLSNKYDYLYFGSDKNHMPEVDIDKGPLFVTPFMGIASIFIGSHEVKKAISEKYGRRNYNLSYKEWSLPEKELGDVFKTVHVYVEGIPELEPFELEHEGFIHHIFTKDYDTNIYRYEWMSPSREYLIANTDNMKVEFGNVTKCKVRYIVESRSGRNKPISEFVTNFRKGK